MTNTVRESIAERDRLSVLSVTSMAGGRSVHLKTAGSFMRVSWATLAEEH